MTRELPPTSIFIPNYNSSKYIQENISVLFTYMHLNFKDFEIIIVDDNSSDNSLEILYKIQENTNKVFVIENSTGPSKRENLGKAMTSARFDYVLFLDQDLAVPLTYIKEAINKITNSKYEIILGSRYRGIKPQRSFHRHLLSKLLNTFIMILFNSRVKDSFCGFKVFKKNCLLALLNEIRYDSTFKRGWFWDVELILKAQKKSQNIYELPVKWRENKPSTVNISKEYTLLLYTINYFIKNKRL